MGHEKPNVVLQGGPELGEAERLRTLPADRMPGVVKVFRGNRHDHFTPTGRKIVEEDGQLHVFEWSHSTYVAE
jgi:hypothetical protein